MRKVLFALVLGVFLLLMAPPASPARDLCPHPMPDGVMTPRMEQARAWRTAIQLGGAPKNWVFSGNIIRHTEWYEGDPDQEGPNPHGRYAGFHIPPMLHMDERGRFAACEYIEIWLPTSMDDQVYVVLVHEYLHSIFYRRYVSEPFFRMMFEPTDSEAWVRRLWPKEPRHDA